MGTVPLLWTTIVGFKPPHLVLDHLSGSKITFSHSDLLHIFVITKMIGPQVKYN